jgi:diguanylate cyclase
VSVNVSGRQLADAAFVGDVRAALTAAGLTPTALMLEITESVLVQPDAAVGGRLAELRELGVAVAIDDFGTGYSSLAALQHVPADVLKIDRAFVRVLGDDPRDAAIPHAVVTLGTALGLRTVAEGVERGEQAERLRAMHCPLAQGFHFARPLELADVPAALARAPRDPRAAGR